MDEKANKFLADLLISKFSGLMGGLDAIKDPKQMDDELSKNKLLRRNVENISSLTPFLPYISLLSGSITVGKHVSKLMYNKVSEEKSQKNDSEKGKS